MDCPGHHSRHRQSRDHPNEYANLQEDTNRLRATWATASNSSDLWRRIEQSGLDNALKKLHQTKADLSIVSSISCDDAANITGVMVELSELLNDIRLAYINNEEEIYDNDEREFRYLTSSSPKILELWRHYSQFAAQFATNLVLESWKNSTEHRELLRSTIDVCASSVKLIVMSVDIASHHSQTDADTLHDTAVRETGAACKHLHELVSDVSTIRETSTVNDMLTELIGWKLYGISHVTSNVIKVGIEVRDDDDDFSQYDDIVKVVNDLVKELKSSRGETDQEVSQTVAPTPPPVQDKKGNKKQPYRSSKEKESKEVKIEIPPSNDDKRTKDRCIEVLQKISDEYTKHSDQSWESKTLPVIHGANGALLKYRMECYKELGKLSVDICPMVERKSTLDCLALTDDHTLFSDLYVIAPEALACSQEVTIQFPITSIDVPENHQLYLKLMSDGQWHDLQDADTMMVDDEPYMTFNTTRLEAFVSVTYCAADELVVGPGGATYVSETDDKVEVTVPDGCFDEEVTLRIKVLQFDKRGCDSLFVGTVCASVGVEISPQDSDTHMNKQITVQLPMKHDADLRDTDIVVVRYDDSGAQVLDRRQVSVKSVDDGLYTVDLKGFWSLAVLRIRRIFLNMRESIKKEFMVGYGKKSSCNILTFIDHETRGDETQTFVMEIAERRNVDSVVEAKRDVGLIELKKGRSRDILVKRGEEIAMIVDGQIRVTEALSDDNYVLCYLQGANVISASTEIKRDPEKMPDAMIIYKHKPENTVLHSIAIMTRDLSELPTDEITALQTSNLCITDGSRQDKLLEESAAQILKMESLMSLARELNFYEAERLGMRLGVKPKRILQITEETEKDPVAGSFQILCAWRGRFCRSTMADFLVSSLNAIGKVNYASIITEVRQHNRGLEKRDFEHLHMKKPSKKI